MKSLTLTLTLLLSLGLASASQAILGDAIDTIEILPIKDQPGPSVPEPSAALIFGAGMVLTGLAIRRRNR